MPLPKTPFLEDRNIPWADLGKGVRRKVLGYDANLMMVLVDFQKGAVGALHSHPHTQVTYIASGSFEVQMGKEKKVLHAGDSYFVVPRMEHGVVALEAGLEIDVFTPQREDFLK